MSITGRRENHQRIPNHGTDLSGIAASSGFPITETISSKSMLHKFKNTIYRAAGPVFSCIKVANTSATLVLPERDGPHRKSRFRLALLGRNG